ncbi:MAG: HAMP domain-containing sensor histidine kinase [Ferruginibacter sp.]
MQIRSKTLRWLIVLSTFVVAIIIAVQLFWIQKIYRFEQKQFNTNVSKSIRAMYEDLNISGDSSYSFEKNIENPQPDIYLAKISQEYNIDTISNSLSAEFADFDVFTDCKVGLHIKGIEGFTADKYIDMPDANFKSGKDDKIPYFKKDFSYILLFFPHRTQYVIKQMVFWLVSGGLLIVVLIAFSFSIFYLYRQKFLNETQKDFVNNFTHEFKTPLSVIKIAADVLKDPAITGKPEKLNNYAGIIQDQTLHLQQQTQRLLQIAYTEENTLSLQKEIFDAGELMEQAANELAPLIESKAGSVEIVNESHNSKINADKSYLLLTFINLIENAVKYSVKPFIEITTFIEGNDFCAIIKDSGIGIEKKHQKKIFKKFYRVTSGDLHNVTGFGLGLNFVKKIMDAHHGSIEVQSEYGKGSFFIIKIPRT